MGVLVPPAFNAIGINLYGTHAVRPPAVADPDTYYYETDTFDLFQSQGGAWVDLYGDLVHIDRTETITGAKTFSSLILVPAQNSLVGGGTDATAGGTSGFQVSTSFNNPAGAKVLQAFGAWVQWTGNPTCTVSLQGGGVQSNLYYNGAPAGHVTQAIVGWESIASLNGDVSATVDQVGPAQLSTCRAAAANVATTFTVPLMIGTQVAGPGIDPSNVGTVNITESRSLFVQYPTDGTTRYSAYILGQTYVKGIAADTANLFVIASSGGAWMERIDQSGNHFKDTRYGRLLFTNAEEDIGGVANVSSAVDGRTVFVAKQVALGTSNIADFMSGAAVNFSILASGQFQTVAANEAAAANAGAGGALPATVQGYVMFTDSGGVVRKIPYYAT